MIIAKIRDITHIIGKLSFLKLINYFKVINSYVYTRLSGKPTQWGLPLSIAIEPTTSCNLRCPECPSGLRQFSRPTGMLEKDFFKKMIDEVSSHILYLTFYFQGEPYLNPKFLDMVKYASSKKIYTSTSTNAHYINDDNARKTIESGLDRLIISIDGITQDTYEQYRVGGDLEKVLAGAKKMIEWKRKLKSNKPHLIFQFLVVKPNEHQVNDVKKLAKQLGVNEVRVKTAQLYDHKNGNPLMPSIQKYSRYKQQPDGTYKIKNELKSNCWRLWHSPVITWDGLVVPCCFDKDALHRMGDLKQMSFKQVWNNKEYKSFREKISKSRSEIDICKNCSEGTRVWA